MQERASCLHQACREHLRFAIGTQPRHLGTHDECVAAQKPGSRSTAKMLSRAELAAAGRRKVGVAPRSSCLEVVLQPAK